MASPKYYAVAQGRPPAPDIFLSWDETKCLVNKHPRSIFKGFSTLEEATAYLAENGIPEHQRVIRGISMDGGQA
ncbi:hypothetical protein BDV37DRAFT_267258 [Aspergillus pseudonomiae]|uniref:Ribonuclease H1 N-terminal domain-containing protein n=1 Tax=Aspergillus pseudonomiae TaxID=1506151 RepID=A0A5N7CRT1_9EURO|nr:uncharacterized protein BDV37DRAFT_267258 [Aspergillus pseudonomiae]KAE8396834.1 hypothetical protein BDV37DRAFT_267258 [Aspergillus pseudonomiae]